jgi:hypothetical protein
MQEPSPRDLLCRQVGYVLASKSDPAGGEWNDAAARECEAGLAGAVTPEERNDLAGADFEADILDGDSLAVLDPRVTHL